MGDPKICELQTVIVKSMVWFFMSAFYTLLKLLDTEVGPPAPVLSQNTDNHGD